jgi:hypothetical protein
MSDFPTPTAAMSPYQTPSHSSENSDDHSAVSAMVVNQLVRTRAWVRLCSVLGFVGSAFMVLAGLAMLLGGAAASATMANNSATPAMYGSGMIAGMGAAYLVFSILYIYPSLKLWQYASGISQLESSQHTIDLETALDKQRSFWKFVGLMFTIILCLYGLAIVVGIIAAVAMGVSS